MTDGKSSVACRYQNGVLTATVSGEIDHHSAKEVREVIDRALYYHRPAQLNMDLGNVGFMDSSGLGLILGRVSTAESVDCHVNLVNIPKRVLRILNMAGVQRIPTLSLLSIKKENA